MHVPRLRERVREVKGARWRAGACVRQDGSTGRHARFCSESAARAERQVLRHQQSDPGLRSAHLP